MSVPPTAHAAYISAPRNGQDTSSFHKFFESWLVEQNRHLHQLLSASKDKSSLSDEEEERVLRPLITVVVKHYEEYYQAKSKWSKDDVLSMFSPSWTSSLEDAFLWIGGWRPSMAFHLLYSKSGLQLEAKLAEIMNGLSSSDLGDLTPSQLGLVDELQRKTVLEEKRITEKMAKHQETVADTAMVKLSQLATELQIGLNEGVTDEQVDSTLAPKEEGLQRVLEKSDDLRLRTLKAVINILKPIQAIHFLIAAAELHLRIHEWGQKKDAANNNAASNVSMVSTGD
ncbi:hypothetical protein ACHQM5_022840 [Ranunculus cassubicifolius]